MEYLEKFASMLGARIRNMRVQRNMSQEDLAEHSGLHRTYIGMVERGERNITLHNYARIVLALGASMEDFFRGLDRADE